MQSELEQGERRDRRSLWRKLWISLPLSLLAGWLLAGSVQSHFIATVSIGGLPARQMTLRYPNLVAFAVLIAVVVVCHVVLWRPKVRFGLRTLFFLTTAFSLLCATLGVRYMTARAEQRTVALLGGEAVTEYGRVVELTFERADRNRLLDEELARLERLPKVRTLSLRFARITDEGLAQLHRLPELHELALGHAGHLDDDVDLVPICGATYQGWDVTTTAGRQRVESDLRRQLLVIRNAKITDAGMKYVGQLASLRVLSLDDTAIGDEGLERLAGLAELRELDLNRTYVTDDGMKWLTHLPRLERLWLSNTRYLTDAGMEHVARIASLRELSPPWQTSAKGLALLQKLPHLEKLILTHCQASLQPISRLPQLRELTVSGSATDEDLKQLRGLKQLRKLDLAGSAVSNAALQELQRALPQCEIVR